MDNLLRCNGYSSPRDMMKTHIKGISGPTMDSSSVCLKLPYISEQISDHILKFIKNCGLPIRVVFTPGKKLRNLFCYSRPYDKPVSESKTCQICSRLVEGKDCSIMYPIYQITCNFCNKLYMTGWGNTCGLPQTPVTQATKMRPLLRTMVSTILDKPLIWL